MNGSDAGSAGQSRDHAGQNADRSRRRKEKGDRTGQSDAGGADVGRDRSTAAQSMNQLAESKSGKGKERDKASPGGDAAKSTLAGKDRSKAAGSPNDKDGKKSEKQASDNRDANRGNQAQNDKTVGKARQSAQSRDTGTGTSTSDATRQSAPDKTHQPGIPRARWAAGGASAAQQLGDRGSANAPSGKSSSQFDLVSKALSEHEAKRAEQSTGQRVANVRDQSEAKLSSGNKTSENKSNESIQTTATAREGGSQLSLLKKALLEHDAREGKTAGGGRAETQAPSLLDFARTGDATIAYLRYLEKKLASQAKPGATDRSTSPKPQAKGQAIPRWLASYMAESGIEGRIAKDKPTAERTAQQRTESGTDRDQAKRRTEGLRPRRPPVRTFLSAGRPPSDDRANQRSLDRARLGLSSHRIRLDAAGAFNRAAMRRTMFRHGR